MVERGVSKGWQVLRLLWDLDLLIYTFYNLKFIIRPFLLRSDNSLLTPQLNTPIIVCWAVGSGFSVRLVPRRACKWWVCVARYFLVHPKQLVLSNHCWQNAIGSAHGPEIHAVPLRDPSRTLPSLDRSIIPPTGSLTDHELELSSPSRLNQDPSRAFPQRASDRKMGKHEQ